MHHYSCIYIHTCVHVYKHIVTYIFIYQCIHIAIYIYTHLHLCITTMVCSGTFTYCCRLHHPICAQAPVCVDLTTSPDCLAGDMPTHKTSDRQGV